MKKIFLLAAGTVTGLGAVLSITPPVLNDSVGTLEIAGGFDVGTGATPSATTEPSAPSAPSATPITSATATAVPKPATSATVKPTVTTPAPTTGFSGTVNGASFAARSYGTVSVSVTFSNGKIKSVSASQSLTSWSDQSLSVIIPFVNAGSITIEQVKQASSAELPCSTSNSCNSRASYTADAFWSSLKSAITKVGL
jgi:hypothetical protein